MGFLADRAVRHRAGVEPLDDFGGGLDLVERNRFARHEREQAAERHQIAVLVVDGLGILGIEFRIVLEDRVLQFDDRVGVPEMLFAVEPELVFAAEIEIERSRVRAARKPARCRSIASRAITSRSLPAIREGVPVK